MEAGAEEEGVDALAGVGTTGEPRRRVLTTQVNPSTKIARDIFDWPTRRSANTIGTSRSRYPLRHIAYASSTWKA